MGRVSVDVILKAYDDFYEDFYENQEDIPYYRALVFAGDCLLEKHGDIVRTIADYRGDMFVSDRELASLVCALAEYNII